MDDTVHVEVGDQRRLIEPGDSAEISSDEVKSQRNGHVSPPRDNSESGLILNATQVRPVNGRDTIESNTYTELLRGSVPCPTCRGAGSIPKEQEDQLVALIPLKDKRLKPRRTYLYVCLAVFLCLTAAGLLLFFMFPRNVTIESNKPFLHPKNLSISVAESTVKFYVTNPINITNQNYFPVTINRLSMTLLFRTKVIASAQNNMTKSVPIRDTVASFVDSQVKFSDANEFGYMAILCSDKNKWFHEFVMVFQFTAYYSYLGHTEMTSLTTYQSVSCGNDTAPAISTFPPETTKPPTTSRPTSIGP